MHVSDGTNWGTGVDLYAGTTASYVQSTTAATVIAAASTIGTTWIAGSGLTINAGTVLTTTTGTGTQDYICSQIRVTSTATAGITTARALKSRAILL